MSVIRHTGYNVAASLAPIVVSLATVPAQIHYLGEARFGVLAIFAILLGYFGVFDLGISRAIAQRIAAAGEDAVEERRTIFWSGVSINLVMGAAGAIVVLPTAWWFFATQMKAPPELHHELVSAAWWLALAVPAGLLTQVLRGALQGGQQFAALNLIGAVGNVASQVLPLAAAIWISPQLPLVIPVLFLTRLLTLAALGAAVAVLLLRGMTPRFDRARAKDLLSFGGWVAVSSFVSPLMTAFDRVLIGSMVSASAVSHYTVPYQLGERALVLPVGLTDALFPRIAARDEAAARDMSRKAMVVIGAVMTPLMVAGIVGLKIFLSLWINPDFAAQASLAGAILFAGFCFNAMATAMYVSLQAGGKPRMVAIAHLIEVVPFLGLLWIGLHFWGLTGAAVASALRVSLDMLLLSYFAALLRTALRLCIMPAVLLACALAIGPAVSFSNPYALLAGAFLIAISAMFGLRRLAREGIALPAMIAARLHKPRPA